MSNRVQLVVLQCDDCPFIEQTPTNPECTHPHVEGQLFAVWDGVPQACPLRENSLEVVYGGRS